MVLVGAVWQFLDVAVVIGGESSRSSLAAAYGFMTGTPVSVLGYMLIRWIILGPGLLIVAGVWTWWQLDSTNGSLMWTLNLLVLIGVVVPLVVVVSFAYSPTIGGAWSYRWGLHG